MSNSDGIPDDIVWDDDIPLIGGNIAPDPMHPVRPEAPDDRNMVEQIKKVAKEERAKAAAQAAHAAHKSQKPEEQPASTVSSAMPDTGNSMPSSNGSMAPMLERLRKQRLVLQGSDKVVFEGDFLDIHDNFFVLGNPVITGPNHIARPPWVLVDRSTISHIHPVTEVKKKS